MDKNEKPLKRESCIFRVFTSLFLAPAGSWINGTLDKPVIADLSDISDKMIRWLLERKVIETADGEPVNKSTGNRATGKPCPCGK